MYVAQPRWPKGIKEELETEKSVQVGKGAYGLVYCIPHRTSSEQWVVKFLPRPFYNSQVTRRTLREISIMRQCNHPNIISLLGVYVDGPVDANFRHVYLAMPHAGQALNALLRQHRKTPIGIDSATVQLVSRQILAGLRYLHSANIAHRDLKPANIVVEPENGWRVKLIDFGLARQLRRQFHAGDMVRIMSASKDGVPGGGTALVTGRVASVIVGDRGSNSRATVEINGWIMADDKPAVAHVGVDSLQLLETATMAADREESDAEPPLVSPSLNRSLTTLVVTRWYRPPELIFHEAQYSDSVDIWSWGCIYAELLEALEPDDATRDRINQLFKGDGSVDRATHWTQNMVKSVIGNARSQLRVMFGVIGTPTPEERATISNPNIRTALAALPPQPRRDFAELYPHARQQDIDLLLWTLQFDPVRILSPPCRCCDLDVICVLGFLFGRLSAEVLLNC